MRAQETGLARKDIDAVAIELFKDLLKFLDIFGVRMNCNGRQGYLLDLLGVLELFHIRDIELLYN